MMKRALLFGLLAASQFGLAVPVSAREAATLTRKDIRAMPILERPSRPGISTATPCDATPRAKPSMTPANIWEG